MLVTNLIGEIDHELLRPGGRGGGNFDRNGESDSAFKGQRVHLEVGIVGNLRLWLLRRTVSFERAALVECDFCGSWWRRLCQRIDVTARMEAQRAEHLCF